jgi:transcriptional regulator with XRE-family HTH domain
MICMTSVGEIVLAWRTARGWNTRELAEFVGTSRQNIENLEAGEVGQPRYLPRLAKCMGYASTDELLALKPPPESANSSTPGAHSMSQRAWKMDSIRPLLWEELLMLKKKEDLPPLFQVAAPDNAMAPRLKQGVKATFERDLVPVLGDGVLVKDNAGELHIRYYRRGRAGTWEAHAESEHSAPLLSDRDGLEVWAVLTAVEGRWS